jgi:hypothetical protein
VKLSEPRRHHSVPRFLLQGFAVKKGNAYQTRVFDKRDARSFPASIRDVMVERDFNSIKTEAGVISLETYISNIEDAVAPIVAKLVKAEKASVLTGAEKQHIALFVALQLVRGTGYRAQFLDLAKQFRDVLERRAGEYADQLPNVPDDDAVKLQALHTIAKSLPEFAAHLRHKDMLIFRAPKNRGFLIGDNPVVMDNHRDFGFYGNIGLAVAGIQIYLPLSESIALGLWAPDIREEMKTRMEDVRKSKERISALATIGNDLIRSNARAALAEVEAKASEIEHRIRRMDEGGPIHCDEENMDRFNSMQIYYAERFLASADGNFDLPKRMMVEVPKVREGGLRGRVD